MAERLHRLGNTLRAANNHYNETVTGLVGKQGLHSKVERFQQLSTRANKEMAALEPIHDEIENNRLESTIDSAGGDVETLEQNTGAATPVNVKSISGD